MEIYFSFFYFLYFTHLWHVKYDGNKRNSKNISHIVLCTITYSTLFDWWNDCQIMWQTLKNVFVHSERPIKGQGMNISQVTKIEYIHSHSKGYDLHIEPKFQTSYHIIMVSASTLSHKQSSQIHTKTINKETNCQKSNKHNHECGCHAMVHVTELTN